MPNYLSGDGPPKKKPKQSAIEAAMASTVQRPDPAAIPRSPKPRTIPEFYLDKNKNLPPEEQLNVRTLIDPDIPRSPFPFRAALNKNKVASELEWQYPFLDTLTQVVGNEPGYLLADAYPANYVTGSFLPAGRTITLGGNVIPSAVAQPEDVRWSAAHEYGHLLTHNDNRILQAFVNAAPLPKRLNVTEADSAMGFNKVWAFNPAGRQGNPAVDTTRNTNINREYLAGEAFADMFADALSQRLPGMSQAAQRKATHYPFTPQFGGRSRQVLMDSLVNSLTERLKQ